MSSRKTRRSVLQSLSISVLSITGCLTNDNSADNTTQTQSGTQKVTQTSTNDSTLTLGETYETADGITVTVKDVQTKRLIRSTSIGSSTHIDVAWLDSYQFAVVDVKATDSNGESVISKLQFALEIDGTHYPRPDQNWYWAFPISDTTNRPGIPAFPAPIADVQTAAVLWRINEDKVVRWALPSKTIKQFSQAAEFSIKSFDAPASVVRGDSFEASITISNTGNQDEQFIAEFGAGPLSDKKEIAVNVPANATVDHTEMLDPHYTKGTEELKVILNWGQERLSRTVKVSGS